MPILLKSQRRPVSLLGMLLLPTLVFACQGESAHVTNDVDGTALEGTAHAWVSDLRDGSHRMTYSLEQPSGAHVELVLDAGVELRTGQAVRLHGSFGSDRKLFVVSAVERLGAEGPIGEATSAITDGKPRTLKVGFALLRHGASEEQWSEEEAIALIQKIHDYYLENSFGMLDVQGELLGSHDVDLLPEGSSFWDLFILGRETLRAAGVSVEAYDHVQYLISGPPFNQWDGICGRAELGSPVRSDEPVLGEASYVAAGCGAKSAAHEFGHGLGFAHANALACGDDVTYRRNPFYACHVHEYGDEYNVMGNYEFGTLNAYQKLAQGWLSGCNHVHVTQDASFDLVDISTPSDAVQALQIATGDDQEGRPLFYYVELRGRLFAEFACEEPDGQCDIGSGVLLHLGFDSTPEEITLEDRQTVQLDLSPAYSSAFYQDPLLPVDGEFVDPDGRVTIRLRKIEGGVARVEVSFPDGGGTPNRCGDGSQPPVPRSDEDWGLASPAADADSGVPVSSTNDASVTGGLAPDAGADGSDPAPGSDGPVEQERSGGEGCSMGNGSTGASATWLPLALLLAVRRRRH